MKWVYRAFIGVFAILILGVAGGYLWLRTSLPQYDGEVALAGIDASVRIVRDRDGIPHIRAQTDGDAYFALGFVHAQDRLFQMDFMRRFGAGRLSEVVGEPALAIDRTTRTLGLYRLAEESLKSFSPEARDALEAYAAGVNAFLETRGGALPLEFVALRYKPEKWRPADSLVWGRIMAQRLSGNWHTEALRAALGKQLSPEQIAELWPPADGKAPPTISTASVTGAPTMFADLLRDFPTGLGPLTASNSWAISGRNAASGKPILANDPHLGYGAPILWYLARIETPTLSVTGATVPGVPFTVLGHNGRIAWGLTTTQSDTQDLFIERLDPASRDRYQTPDGPRAFTLRNETIPVRDGQPFHLTIRETRHGPVLSDVRPDLLAGTGTGRGHVVALAATSLTPNDRTAEALYRINRARDWPSFLAATRLFHAPHQNISYADATGNIGFIAAAHVPIRKSGDGKAPVPGWTGDHDWTGFIPFDELPRVFNPPSGRIVNANHRIVADDYRHYLGQRAIPGYRAARIHQRLDEVKGHKAVDSANMQYDEVSLMFRELGPLLLKAPPLDDTARRVHALLGQWDGDMDRGRPEPLIFVAWLQRLNALIYGDELGDMFDSYRGLRPAFMRRVLTSRGVWCDDIQTAEKETCETMIARALSDSVSAVMKRQGDDMASWRWGAAHAAHFRHPVFGRIPVLMGLFDLRIETGGGSYTVNKGGVALNDWPGPFTNRHGAGFRAVYDLARLDDSRFVIATGQSGNWFSPFYGNMLNRWRDGKYIEISPGAGTATKNAVGVLELKPARPPAGSGK